MLPLALLLSCNKEPINNMKPQQPQIEKALQTGGQKVYFDNRIMPVSIKQTVYPHGANTGVISRMNRIYTLASQSDAKIFYVPVMSAAPTNRPMEILEYDIKFKPQFRVEQFTSSSEIDRAAARGEITISLSGKAFEIFEENMKNTANIMQASN